MKILIFIALITLGFVCVIYAKWITDNTTRFDFAEKFLGMGGTYNMWKLIGVVLIAFSFYYLIKM